MFDGDRYFDVFVEYAKASPEDLLVRVQVINRGPLPATLTVLPTIWFRNTWSWGLDAPPADAQGNSMPGVSVVEFDHDYYGRRQLLCEGLLISCSPKMRPIRGVCMATRTVRGM